MSRRKVLATLSTVENFKFPAEEKQYNWDNPLTGIIKTSASGLSLFSFSFSRDFNFVYANGTTSDASLVGSTVLDQSLSPLISGVKKVQVFIHKMPHTHISRIVGFKMLDKLGNCVLSVG